MRKSFLKYILILVSSIVVANAIGLIASQLCLKLWVVDYVFAKHPTLILTRAIVLGGIVPFFTGIIIGRIFFYVMKRFYLNL